MIDADINQGSGSMLMEDDATQEIRYIGPLTIEQRMQKVKNYWRKKYAIT